MEVGNLISISLYLANDDPYSSSEGVQIANVQSGYGILGTWTTVFHEDGDPVGKYMYCSPRRRKYTYDTTFRSILAA